MDIINAFNSPNHRAIFFIMAANGFPGADVALFQRMYTGSFLVMSNPFGITAACFLARGTPQGAPPSSTVYCLIYDPILKMIRACHRGCSMQEGSTPSGASCLADDLLLHTEGPDAVPAMNIMVNAIAPILKWTGLEVHMIKSQCTGINHVTRTQVATDKNIPSFISNCQRQVKGM